MFGERHERLGRGRTYEAVPQLVETRFERFWVGDQAGRDQVVDVAVAHALNNLGKGFAEAQRDPRGPTNPGGRLPFL